MTKYICNVCEKPCTAHRDPDKNHYLDCAVRSGRSQDPIDAPEWHRAAFEDDDFKNATEVANLLLDALHKMGAPYRTKYTSLAAWIEARLDPSFSFDLGEPATERNALNCTAEKEK